MSYTPSILTPPEVFRCEQPRLPDLEVLPPPVGLQNQTLVVPRSRQLTFKSSRGGSGNLGNLGNLKISLHEVPLGWFGESGESDKSLHGESGESGESDKVVTGNLTGNLGNLTKSLHGESGG